MWKMLLFNIIYLIIHSFFWGGGLLLSGYAIFLPAVTYKRDDKQKWGKKKKH